MEEEKIYSMEQPNDEQVEIAERKEEISATSKSTDGSIGKFKDSESLLNAYNSLQAEFTRKCQKLSELTDAQNEKSSSNNLVELNDELKQNLVKEYLSNLQKTDSPTVITTVSGSGIPLKTPPKPTTLEEASGIVRNLFN